MNNKNELKMIELRKIRKECYYMLRGISAETMRRWLYSSDYRDFIRKCAEYDVIETLGLSDEYIPVSMYFYNKKVTNTVEKWERENT